MCAHTHTRKSCRESLLHCTFYFVVINYNCLNEVYHAIRKELILEPPVIVQYRHCNLAAYVPTRTTSALYDREKGFLTLREEQKLRVLENDAAGKTF